MSNDPDPNHSMGCIEKTVRGGFLSVSITDGVGSGSGNKHRMIVTLDTDGGNEIELLEHTASKFSFVIIGSCESSEFLDAMQKLTKDAA